MAGHRDPMKRTADTSAAGISNAGHAAALGERIRLTRLAQGRSLRAVAGGKLSASLVSRVERGLAAPSLDTLRFLAAQLGCSPGYLLGSDERPAAHGPCETADVLTALLGLLSRALDADSSPEGIDTDAAGSDPETGDAGALVTVAVQRLRETGHVRSRGMLPTSVADEATDGYAGAQTLAERLLERLRSAYEDALRASAGGATVDALVAAGRGLGLIETHALCQTCLDHLLRQALASAATGERMLSLVAFEQALGYAPDTPSILDLAEQALERGQIETCCQLLGTLADDQVRTHPRAQRIRGHLAFRAGDVLGAVAQWEQLADDATVPAEYAIDTLMEAGMLLDEARHAPEAQTMYRRAAVLWQQLGPRSPVTSRLPSPRSLERGHVTGGNAEGGRLRGGGETRQTWQERALRQGGHQH